MPLTGIELDTPPSTVILIPVPASILFTVPPSAEGTFIKPEPSPTKNAALTMLLNVATEADTLATLSVVSSKLTAIVGLPSVPSALPIVIPEPAVSVLPYTLPPLTATRPVAPVRSATLFSVDALAVRVTPLS